MTNLKGGYILVNKNDANIYASVENALNAGKSILWYENSTTCYYIDSISKSGDDIVLTKGGKTITITDANVVTESGDIQNHLYQHSLTIVTSEGFYSYANVLVTNNETIDTSAKLYSAIGKDKIIASGYSSSYGDGGADVLYIIYDDANTFMIGFIDIDSKDTSEEGVTITSISDSITQLF